MTFRTLSIRGKLLGAILLTTALSLIGGFAFVVLNDVRAFKQDTIESTVLMARVVGEGSVSVLAFGDRVEAAKVLAKLQDVPGMEAAYLFDAQGELFAVFDRSGARDVPKPRTEASREFSGGRLHVFEPIVYQKERYGTLYLAASTQALDTKIRRHMLVMLTALSALILLSLLFALRLQRIVSEPILRLATTARWISEAHDYSVRVAKTGEDEIGVLCDDFNDMLSQIERRQQERDAADRKTREKSQFLANMSHELRTPLNSIIGFSEILLDRLGPKLSAKEAKFLQNINSSGQHLLGIVNDILDLSKVEAGRMEVIAETFPVLQAVEGVCVLMKGVSSKRSVTFNLDVPADLPKLTADPVKFKQVLYNLLANAVKFSPPHSTVSVAVRPLTAADSPLGEPALEVAVADQGPGIDPAEQATLFQEFHQTSSSRGLEGTGLGLALVRKFVELHRGTVAVDSRPGEGSRFVVRWPIEFRGVGTVAESGPLTPAPRDDRPRVLVIESEAAAYEALRRPLLAAHYSPAWARDPDEAMRLARTLRPVAVTLDLSLPHSWDLLKRLKQDRETRDIPLVVVSLVDDREPGIALGADDYLPKPLDVDALVDRLRALAPHSHAGRARLLLIDDDPQVHEMLGARLASLGYHLDGARSGTDGLLRAVAGTPDLILLDLMMEGMDGFEVAVRLRSDPRTARIPIVVLTAYDLSSEQRARLRGRIDALVRKGESTGEQLVATIRALVSRREAEASPPPAAS